MIFIYSRSTMLNLLRNLVVIFAAAAMFGLSAAAVFAAPDATPGITISDTPLALVEPTHPQVLLLVPNSQSMDGDLSGAIMTGSGIVSSLNASSSPEKYDVPPGFTPPAQSADATGLAPFTVDDKGTLIDNSASRLNVAKQSIALVLQKYAANFDFGLMVYNTWDVSRYETWVYMMSGSGGFSFGDRSNTPPAGTAWEANPCYQNNNYYCDQIDDHFSVDIQSKPDVAIAASSDDPDINDVLYATSGYRKAFLTFGSHSPSSPFPPSRTLAQFNNGNITVTYTSCDPSPCVRRTSPTNAGYVPFSDQVIYAKRGFGFYSSQSKNRGDLLVPVEPASTQGALTQTELNVYLSKFQQYLQPQTDEVGTGEIKALGVQSPIAGLLHWARKYYDEGVEGYDEPASNTGCPCNKYVVMLTDGLPTEDLDGKAWPPLGTASADGYGVSAAFYLAGGGTISTDDSNFKAKVVAGKTMRLESTTDQAVKDAIDKLEDLADDGIQTYIVGMGAGVDPTKNPAAAATMKAMAIAGDTNDYFPGVTPQDVANHMQVIFSQIQAANQSSSAVAVNSTSFQTSASVYQARYDSASYGWTGDLISYPFNADGSVNQMDPNWQARATMDAQLVGAGWNTNRLAVTVDEDTGNGVPFRWNQLSADQKTSLKQHWNQLTASQKSDDFGNDQDAYGQAVLAYLRGGQSNTTDNNGVFRSRRYLLGDIVHSAPLYVGAPHQLGLSSGYAAFANAHANRKAVIYAGANDGALHAVDANTGKELFAFFPLAPFDGLADLSVPTYNQNHAFYVDGSPNGGDARFADGSPGNASDDTWHTLVVGGLNSGGKGIYALDVTDPSGFTSESNVASNVLWTITDETSGFGHLGLTYSQPQIVAMNCDDGMGGVCNDGFPTYVAMFGSGYNNDDGNPYFYVVNIETGHLIQSIDLCAEVATSVCNEGLPNGLSTPVTVSSTGDPETDLAYAGDLQGHLWRIDLSDPSPSNWGAMVLLTARNEDGEVQAITTQPAVARAPAAADPALPAPPPATPYTVDFGIMVYFGTGRYLGASDINDTRVQSFYGVLDNMVTTGLTRSDLESRTLTQTSVAGTPVRTVAGDPIDWATQYGWRMALPVGGERSITDPVLRSGRIVFTSFIPNADQCAAAGQSWLNILDFATGGALPAPELDLNHDGKLDSNDQTGAGRNPVSVSLGAGFAASPAVIQYGSGGFGDVKLITVSGRPIKSVKERGMSSGVLSWAQIR